MKISIYRAFSETFDKYILGVPYFSDGRYYMLVDDCNKNNNIGSGSYPIDETTLAIHFPDMLDSQGNKIFASLQNRSCANCKYNKEQDNFMIFCDKTMCQDGSKMMWHSFTKDFNCKYWEPKQ